MLAEPRIEPVAGTRFSVREEILFVLKASRPGFWLTAIWFSLRPLAPQVRTLGFDFWFGIAFVSFAFGLFIYGWNYVAYVEYDRFNARKGNYLFGARGTRVQLSRLYAWIITLHLACALFMTWRYGPRVIGWYAAFCAATSLYNWPRIGFKRWPV